MAAPTVVPGVRYTHAIRPWPKSAGGGWRVPVTECGWVVPAGTEPMAVGVVASCATCQDRIAARPPMIEGI